MSTRSVSGTPPQGIPSPTNVDSPEPSGPSEAGTPAFAPRALDADALDDGIDVHAFAAPGDGAGTPRPSIAAGGLAVGVGAELSVGTRALESDGSAEFAARVAAGFRTLDLCLPNRV